MLKPTGAAEHRRGRKVLQERRRPLRGHLSGLRVHRRRASRPHNSGKAGEREGEGGRERKRKGEGETLCVRARTSAGENSDIV